LATLQEKEHTLETIKGPRFYRIMLNGYGGEHVYGTLTQEQYDFWKPVVEEHGDSDLCNYALNAEEGKFDFDNIDEVPPSADFLMSEGSDGKSWRSNWFEMPTEFEHINNVSVDSAYLTVDEVSDADYSAQHIREVIEGEDLNEWANKISEDTNYEIEVMEPQDDSYPEKGTHIVQMLSIEKGTFFEGIVETIGDFDPTKLRIQSYELPNGEDTVSGVYYDGEELDNCGGDTNGKGYTAAVWTQEF